MPYQIDQEAIDSPSLTMLDIGKPPTKSIAYQAYPKMIYLHPKDKTNEHRIKIVENVEELEAAEAQGWKTQPHIPEAKPEDLSAFETPRRGPGRPPNAGNA